jgi:tRNA (cytidine32/uridine32-2'-O)-methyltransferase
MQTSFEKTVDPSHHDLALFARLNTQIKIVMIQTTHSGNIGSAARAMKTMGLGNLCLVAPLSNVDDQCFAMASSAKDVVDSIDIYQTLEDAIADCQLVIGASARDRQLAWPQLNARECGKQSIAQIEQQTDGENHKVAILFGREASGLTNEELQACQYHVHIPSNPDYSSLNIASAIQLIAYECRMSTIEQCNNDVVSDKKVEPLASGQQLTGFYQHLEKMLVEVGFLNPENPRQLMAKLKRLFSRTQLENNEVNILRGVLTAVMNNQAKKQKK